MRVIRSRARPNETAPEILTNFANNESKKKKKKKERKKKLERKGKKKRKKKPGAGRRMKRVILIFDTLPAAIFFAVFSILTFSRSLSLA
jgi:hypothetical protein